METIKNFPEITKKDFPLLNKNFKSNEQIIYLDHAATTQKPIQVLKKIEVIPEPATISIIGLFSVAGIFVRKKFAL